MAKISSIYDRSHVPLYAQVASVMRQRIESGYWLEGDKISTLDELEKEFGVARVTIRQAIELLSEEGLLSAQQGRGTFVLGAPKENRWLNLATDFESMVSSLKGNVLKCMDVKEGLAPPALRDGEGEAATDYAFIRSVQYNNNEPFSVVNLHLSQAIFEKDRKSFMRAAAIPRLIEMDDVSIAHVYQTFVIGVADPETADLLKIGLGDPIADCRLVMVDAKGVAVYVAGIHYRKDCFALHVDLLEKTGPVGGKRSRRPAPRTAKQPA